MSKEKLTQFRLKELLDYNPDTGVFIWKDRVISKGRKSVKAGRAAGTLCPSGYIQIKLDCRAYLAHRLAWLWVHGYLSENQIDHIDGVRNNNSIKNLRESSASCNMQNKKIHSGNKSGITGICWHKKARVWQAQITINKKQIYLGRFDNLLEAAMARHDAECEHFNCIVKSSAKKYIEENI